eukprot:TRINITY_DN10413_c0_g1_i1.p1 TRINITY_DN10413_c0_g1~~TRINITY_DN10413_c0_g1_i1.p1  ORF type:complete len:422 (-),score=46.17 TRINITY_DN10413_c0_g1_i1:69-1334(-)
MSNGPGSATASTTAITLNLITMGLGSGLLTMPWGVAGASIVVSLGLLAFILWLNHWTCMLLVRASDQEQAFDLGSMLSRLPSPMGKILQALGDTIIFASQFLVLLGYIIVIVSTVERLAPHVQRQTSAAILTILLLPLSFLDQKYLACTSTMSIATNIYLICLLIYYAMDPPNAHAEESLCVLGFASGSVTMFSLLMYTIIIQMAVPPMYKELEGRTPEKFCACLTRAFVFLFALFAAVMVCGYVAFGTSVSSSVLDSLPNDILGSLARGGMSLCLIGCYPLNLKPMSAPFSRRTTESTLLEPLHGDVAAEGGVFKRMRACDGSIIASTVIIIGVSISSLWVTDLGPLNAVNGAIQVLGYIGAIPGIIGLYLLEGRSNGRRVALVLLIIFATTLSVLGFVFTDNDASDLNRACMVAWQLQP